MTLDEQYMLRCLELAKKGAGNVAPNPMVGAVLLHQCRIIGEGYHQQYGGPHAEVHCIDSVQSVDRPLIAQSTLYVSLEPCAHFGKTPPCADLIIRHCIPKVVIGAVDPFAGVNGKGIEKLRSAGIEVIQDVLSTECEWINRRFFHFQRHRRPFVVLKWAETADGKIGSGNAERWMISNEFTNRRVHKWRSEEAAILVGRNTALQDDPSLNVRWWNGKNPLRLIIDPSLSLPGDLKIFSDGQPVIIFNRKQHLVKGQLTYYQLPEAGNLVMQLMKACYELNIQSVLVEGGAVTLQSFIDAQCWDEARVITNTAMHKGNGVAAPQLKNARATGKETVLTDRIVYFAPDVNRT